MGASVPGRPCCSCAFSNMRFWHSCLKKIRKLYLFGLFPDHLSTPLESVSALVLVPCCFGYDDSSRIWDKALLQPYSLHSGLAGCPVSIVLLSELPDGFSNSLNDTLEFWRFALNLWVTLSDKTIFIILILPVQEHRMSVFSCPFEFISPVFESSLCRSLLTSLVRLFIVIEWMASLLPVSACPCAGFGFYFLVVLTWFWSVPAESGAFKTW